MIKGDVYRAMRDILFRAKAINRDPDREYRTNYKNGDWVYGIRCNACHARGSVASKTIQGRIFSGYDEELEIEAIKLWNRWEGAFDGVC